MLTVTIAIFSASAESTQLRNLALLTQLTKRSVRTVLGLGSRWRSCPSMEVRSLCLWLAVERRRDLLLGKG